MEQSVLNKISANNILYYFEGWRNGKKGAITQGHGKYYFVEMARNAHGILDSIIHNTEDNPVVAVGIVAYWLMFKSDLEPVLKAFTRYKGIPESMKELFDNYTQDQFWYFREMHRDNPDSWDWDWDYEFYGKYIIPNEMDLNNRTEALFDYISYNDIQLVRSVMSNYINYLKKVRQEKGYHVSPELLVMRYVANPNVFILEGMEDYEVNTILDDLERYGYIHVAWISGHRHEGVRLLDRGRVYLKKLEEESVAQSAELITPLNYGTSVKEESQPKIEWDSRYDDVFDVSLAPQKIFVKLEKMDDPRVQDYYPRFFVFYRVLLYLGWIKKKQNSFLKWANLHWKCGWDENITYKFKFGNNIQKELRNADISTWNDKTLPKSNTGSAYRALAVKVLAELTEKVNGNKIIDRIAYYKEDVKKRINDGKHLDYPF